MTPETYLPKAREFPVGHNGGPQLDALTLAEAQELETVRLRPSYVERYCGPGSPARRIVGVAGCGPVGRRVLLECGHMREIRDYDFMPLLKRKQPTSARCGCCRLNYLAEPARLAEAERLRAAA